MRVIAIVNQKGGCGKTTTTVNLAGALAADGHRVLIVDMDPQAHATLAVGQMVRVRPGVSPKHGWGSVKGTEFGKITAISGAGTKRGRRSTQAKVRQSIRSGPGTPPAVRLIGMRWTKISRQQIVKYAER